MRGQVAAARFVMPELRQVLHSSAPVRGRPEAPASWTTEACFGEIVKVFEDTDGWAWVQLESDAYVGYMRSGALTPQVRRATHRVRALGTFLYPEPDVKSAPWIHLSMNAALTVAEVGPTFCRLADGSYVPSRHVAELRNPMRDFVEVAARFVGVPYLWGGKTRLGVDCSGLIQASLQACGLRAPRDSDMQERELGVPVAIASDLGDVQRGDLVFWKGHVGVLLDAFTLLHANGHHMSVVEEPLHAAIERIERSGSSITSVRRMRLPG